MSKSLGKLIADVFYIYNCINDFLFKESKRKYILVSSKYFHHMSTSIHLVLAHRISVTDRALTLVEKCVIDFGRSIGKLNLADIVIDLYDAALQESSHKQYGTGQRAYLRFVTGVHTSGYLLPFPRTRLHKTELTLAFFIASLVVRPSITKAATILGH